MEALVKADEFKNLLEDLVKNSEEEHKSTECIQCALYKELLPNLADIAISNIINPDPIDYIRNMIVMLRIGYMTASKKT